MDIQRMHDLPILDHPELLRVLSSEIENGVQVVCHDRRGTRFIVVKMLPDNPNYKRFDRLLGADYCKCEPGGPKVFFSVIESALHDLMYRFGTKMFEKDILIQSLSQVCKGMPDQIGMREHISDLALTPVDENMDLEYDVYLHIDRKFSMVHNLLKEMSRYMKKIWYTDMKHPLESNHIDHQALNARIFLSKKDMISHDEFVSLGNHLVDNDHTTHDKITSHNESVDKGLGIVWVNLKANPLPLRDAWENFHNYERDMIVSEITSMKESDQLERIKGWHKVSNELHSVHSQANM